MFNWNIKEMSLLNMARIGDGCDKAFACEFTVPVEDKVEFIDRMQSGKLSYIVGLAKAYQAAIPSMKKGVDGNPTDYAKKAWVRKNDIQGLICRNTDSYHDYGDFAILNHRINLFAYPDRLHTRYKTTENVLIDTLFHKQLLECEREESRYWFSQDETAQLLAKVDEKCRTHGLFLLEMENEFDLEIQIANKPFEKNTVIITTYSDYYCVEQEKEFSLDEVHQLDAELTTLDELQAKIEQAEQAYEEAKLTFVEKLKSMAG